MTRCLRDHLGRLEDFREYTDTGDSFSGNYTDIGVEGGNSSGHGDSTDEDQSTSSLSTSGYQDRLQQHRQ